MPFVSTDTSRRRSDDYVEDKECSNSEVEKICVIADTEELTERSYGSAHHSSQVHLKIQ